MLILKKVWYYEISSVVFLTNVALSYSLYTMIKHVLYWQYDSFIDNSNGTIHQYYKEKSTRAQTVDNRRSGTPRLGQEISGRQHLTVQRRQIVITEGRNHTGRSPRLPHIWQPNQRSSVLYCFMYRIGRSEI